MNKHSADATTAEEALAIQETLDSNMATEVAMKNTLLTPRFYTTDFDELDESRCLLWLCGVLQVQSIVIDLLGLKPIRLF